MKSISIITFQWFDNYGTVFQAYALQKTLQSLGGNPRIVPLILPKESWFHRVFSKTIRGTLWKWDKLIGEGWNRRHNGFEAFRRQYFNYGGLTHMSFSEANAFDFKDDALIFGSDNIWSWGCYSANPEMAGTFIGDRIRHPLKYVYAASTGGRIDSDSHCEQTIERIKGAGFRRISLREAANIGAFAAHGITANLVPDPSLLLTAHEWSEVAENDDTNDGQYVFGYDLGHNGVLSVPEGCSRVANWMGYKVKIPYPRRWWHDRRFAVHPTPMQWLADILSARFVVTNSFHGVMFALIFNRPFVFIEIVGDGERGALNMRAFEVLKTAGLENRILKTPSDFESIISSDIDWHSVDERLKRFRQTGIDYLAQVMKEV